MTQLLSLTVTPRTIKGNDARKLRRSGILPGIVYGNSTKDVMIQIPYNEFVKLYKQSGNTNVINVTVADKTYPCLIQDIDVNPVTGVARHVDFLSVNLKVEVTVEVPLIFVGDSEAVVQGAILNENLKVVEVSALPTHVPESIEVDISALKELHDRITVGDLPVTKEFTILTDPELVVVSAIEPQVEEEITTPEEDAAEVAKLDPTPTIEEPKAQ